MASLRQIRRNTQSKVKKKYNLPKSKIGKVVGAMSSESGSPPESTPSSNNYLPERIGNAHRVDQQQKENQYAVQEIDRQLDSIQTMIERQADALRLQEANQQSEEWLSSKPKFKSELTSLFPDDLKNIRKIVKEELRDFARQGGFGNGGVDIPLIMGGGKKPPIPVPPSGPTSKPPSKAGKVMGAIGKLGPLSVIASGAMVGLEKMERSERNEEAYRSAQITKEQQNEADRLDNYELGGSVIGATALGIGMGAVGSMLGPMGTAAGRMAGAWLGGHVGGYIGKSVGEFTKTPVSKAASAMMNGAPNVSVKQQASDIRAIEKIVEGVAKDYKINKDEMLAVAMQESSLNPNAKIKNAVGLFQFMPATWDGLLKSNPQIAQQYGIGKSNSSGNDDRLNVQKSSIMYALLRQENLDGRGGDTTGDDNIDSYIFHLLGAPTARRVLIAYKEKPDSKITNHISSAAFIGNKPLMMVGDKVASVAEFVGNIKSKLSSKLIEVRKKIQESHVEQPKPESADAIQKDGRLDSKNDPRSLLKPLGDVANIKQGVDTNGLQSSLKTALTGLANDFEDMTGSKLSINSAFRSYEKQAALYAADPSKAAKPGNSMHEKGLAFDSDSTDMNTADSMGLLSKNGLTRPLSNEPWHVELAGARGNVKSINQNEERSQMTASVNTKPPASPPVIIAGGGNAAQPQVRMQSSGSTVPLTTRNQESTYAAVRDAELRGLT